MSIHSRLLGLLSATLVAGAVACSDSAGTDPGGGGLDPNAPSLDLAGKATSNDTVISFDANAKDNLGLKKITINVTGGVTFSYDTTFTTAVTSTTIPFTINVPSSVPPGTAVVVTGFALDGSGNKSATDTLRLAVGNIAPPDARVTSPPSGTIAVVGKSIVISLSGKSGLKVRSLGFRTAGVLTAADSSVFSTPLKDSTALTDTLTIPDGTPAGQLQVIPFLYDSLGQRSLGPSIILNVQTAASTSSTPVVSFGITPRVEVNDTIHVEASDQTGITTLGYEVRRTVGGAVESSDSVQSSGQITSQLRTFQLRLPYTTFPTRVFVQAFARNSNGTRAYARLASGETRIDTVDVVAGVTKPLPSGGSVADALYHPRTDRLYLTNIERNRLEVFAFADSNFKTGIRVGSRPWGITAWPRDRSGTMGDTLLVANSGGTSISYVNLNSTSTLSPSGTETFIYALPNIVAYSVTTVESATVPGLMIPQRTVYDFSDRPQYLGATCTGPALPGAACGDVVMVYSTTPTPGQSLPFPRKGTVRWENLNRRTSHFFFEQAMGQSGARVDTLEVDRFAAAGFGNDSVMVHRNRAIAIVPDRLAFRDTTYVRNSGNFRRTVVAEGGPVLGSRSLMYDVTRGIEGGALAAIDLGVSRATDVSDFIANTFQTVKGASINFDGELAAVRGDSTYLIDPTLRLQGILHTTGNSGFDFHPGNTGNGITTVRQNCYSFAASSEPVIEIYENRSYARITTVPVRDPIIGPIKAAVRPSGQIVLVGATVRGVVIVTLASTFLTGCP